MRKHIRYLTYLIVFIGFSWARADVSEDFFNALERDDAHTVAEFLAQGVDVNLRNARAQHPLLFALQARSYKVLPPLLEQASVDVNVRNTAAETPLMLASLRGLSDVCRTLITRGADVNHPGWTPLHYAATGGHVDIIQMLLDKFAYIDAAAPNGSTPLMMAAMYGNRASVELLLDAGADPEIKNSAGLSALDFARQAQREWAVEVIATRIRNLYPQGKW